MQKKQILSVVLILYALITTAQTISVVDKTTQESIPGVIVFSNQPKLSVATNSKGQVDIASFKTADTIFFKNIGYVPVASNYKTLESNKFKLELSESTISLGAVIVSSNRWEEDKIETPNRIEKITKRSIAFQNSQTSADVLETSG
jgi:hemoglobin/transferrin/lactoferrin receptor protein